MTTLIIGGLGLYVLGTNYNDSLVKYKRLNKNKSKNNQIERKKNQLQKDIKKLKKENKNLNKINKNINSKNNKNSIDKSCIYDKMNNHLEEALIS